MPTEHAPDTLRRIVHTARQLAAHLNPRDSGATACSTTSQSRVAIPRFPEPVPISPYLIAKGYLPVFSERVSRDFCRHACDLKASAEHKLRSSLEPWIRTCTAEEELNAKIAEISTIYRRRYTTTLQQWLELLIQRLEEVATAKTLESGSCGKGTSRGAFTQEVTSVLEHAFAQNAYPTRLEKESLAEITNMEYRQVNVWFQNRRTRSKRSGHGVKRGHVFHRVHRVAMTDAKPCPIAKSAVIQSGDGIPISELYTRTTVALRCHTPTPYNRLKELELERPAHAYPAPFPPFCHYDPFPIPNGVQSPCELWPRQTSSGRPAGSLPNDAMEELVVQLAQLSLGNDPARSVASPSGCTTIMPSAPSPALVRHPERHALSQPLRSSTALHSSTLRISNERTSSKPLLAFPERVAPTFAQPSWPSQRSACGYLHASPSVSTATGFRCPSVGYSSSEASDFLLSRSIAR
uniref:A2 mating-type protein n=1 Tax=Phanerodontia chrysosporium TaxID=2822231 RepID=E7DAH5_PHACH|nr:A2 mating-type protein [Phanerodontia chrysosporium]